MIALLTKWSSKIKNPSGRAIVSAHCCKIHGDEPCDCKPALGFSRRGFLRGLTTVVLGTGTGLLKPSTLILPPAGIIGTQSSMLDYPREFSVMGFHVGNYYKFNLGRSALKIKPGEAFNAKLTWPVGIERIHLHLEALKS